MFFFNVTTHFKNINNYLNTNIYSCLETYGGQLVKVLIYI
jgi:hypothetical protein